MNRIERHDNKNADIAVYKGDVFFMIGKRAEIAKAMHIKETTVNFYLSPAYERRAGDSKIRLHMFRMDDDEEE